MKLDPERTSENLLELSSEQRLRIIFSLLKKKSNISNMAKELGATNPEVHRNFTRLLKSGIVKKDPDGNFTLSNLGKAICEQIPSIEFVSENKQFFETHGFGNLPPKFIQRLGALHRGNHIKGFVKVLEKWKAVHKNAKKYIYNILAEVPYDKDMVDIIESKLKSNIKIRSIFSENAIVPDERKKVFEKKNFAKYAKEELLERKMLKNPSIVVLLNEKEACLIFPKEEGDIDMSEMFYSNDVDFHDWCNDYFRHSWDMSTSFQESKLEN